MKINKSIRRLYQENLVLNKLLEIKVKEAFEGKKRSQWFFLCRIKEEESFALKVETGRFSNPNEMEDFFACTLVVENRSSIAEAVTLVRGICEVVASRPPDNLKTHKIPQEFTFDDLRLYVKLKTDDQLPATQLDDIVFEIQIKTFLQHAWGIATHDLIYKGQSVDWGRARVAFQIKAMLEHAELSVERVDFLASSSLLKVTDDKTLKLKEVINWLQQTWVVERLPKDMVRLAENILSISRALRVDINKIIDSVQLDTNQGLGASLQDITPFAVVVRALYNHHKASMEKYLKTTQGNFRIFIADDAELVEKLNSLNGIQQDKLIYL